MFSFVVVVVVVVVVPKNGTTDPDTNPRNDNDDAVLRPTPFLVGFGNGSCTDAVPSECLGGHPGRF